MVNDKKSLLSVGLMFVFALLVLYMYNLTISYEKEEALKKQMDSLLLTLQSKIDEITKITLTSSSILSRDKKIIECMSLNQKEICLSHLGEIKRVLQTQKVLNNAHFHLHTNEFKSFLRLWDTKNSDDDLSSFRYSLEKVKSSKSCVFGVEIGRSGFFIRSIAPIVLGNQQIGSIETAVPFEDINSFFEGEGVAFYVLIKNEFVPIISKKSFDERLRLDNYTIVNQKTNGLSFMKWRLLEGTSYFKDGDNYVLFTPIYDIDNTQIGHYVLTWSEKLSLSTFR